MSRVELVPAEHIHVAPIAAEMREWDRIEAGAMGHSPRGALLAGLAGSVDCFTALVDDEPAAMLGLMPKSLVEGVGSPWLLGTEAVYRNPRAMLGLGPKVFALWSDSTPRFHGLVAAGNLPAIRLLRRWGFELGKDRLEMSGVEFVTFTREGR